MTSLLAFLIPYIAGSIPFAFIITKIFSRKDIRKSGTGNIGAMNSYDITGKAWVGFVVFLLDASKAYLSIYLVDYITDSNFYLILIAAVSVIIGHNYSIFLKFKGGRGLASAVGASIYISPIILGIWVILWLMGIFLIKRNVHVGNVSATFFTPITFFVLPDFFVSQTLLIYPESMITVKWFVVIICLIILIKHIKPLKELFSKKEN